MDRAEKKEAVATLHDVFEKTSVVVVAKYSGLTVAQLQNLRKQARAAGASVQVAKNRHTAIPARPPAYPARPAAPTWCRREGRSG